MIGAPREYRNHTGAAFVFVRSGSTWSQQAELQDSEINPYEEFGASVALSADGNTVAIGGPGDDDGDGALWVYTRSGSSWSEQSQLVADCTSECANQGTGETGGRFGVSVALSSDGNTLIAGAPYDETSEDAYDEGATWVFTRSGSSWTQDGAKLIADCKVNCEYEGTGETGNSEEHNQFGYGVSVSPDGATVMIGAPAEYNGGVWAFTPVSVGTGLSVSPSSVDFGDVPDGEVSSPQTVTVSNVTSQALGLSVAANGSPTPTGITDKTGLVRLETPGACALLPIGPKGSLQLGVSASSSCEVGVDVAVKPAATGEPTVGEFTIPVQIGNKTAAAPLVLTGTGTGLSVSPSTLDFGEIGERQASAPQTVTVTNVTDQELPLSLAPNGSATPAGITDKTTLVQLDTPDACHTEWVRVNGKPPQLSVPASSSCEVGITVDLRLAPGQTAVGPFTIPLLIGPNANATPLTLTGTGTGHRHGLIVAMST